MSRLAEIPHKKNENSYTITIKLESSIVCMIVHDIRLVNIRNRF